MEKGRPKWLDPLRVRRAAAKAGMAERAICRTFRHSFAAHFPEGGYDIRPVRELSGRKDVKTAMIHTHVLDFWPFGRSEPG